MRRKLDRGSERGPHLRQQLTAMAILVDRLSRYVMLCKQRDGHGAEAVRIALARRILTLPANLRRSLTWDQDKEMTEPVRFMLMPVSRSVLRSQESVATRDQRERNGLLRQYLPKIVDLSLYSQQ